MVCVRYRVLLSLLPKMRLIYIKNLYMYFRSVHYTRYITKDLEAKVTDCRATLP